MNRPAQCIACKYGRTLKWTGFEHTDWCLDLKDIVTKLCHCYSREAQTEDKIVDEE